ncbi:hypothetical protein D3C80_1840370 [compost metagenome]
MSEAEVDLIIEAVQNITARGMEWGQDYSYSGATNSWLHHSGQTETESAIRRLFMV